MILMNRDIVFAIKYRMEIWLPVIMNIAKKSGFITDA